MMLLRSMEKNFPETAIVFLLYRWNKSESFWRHIRMTTFSALSRSTVFILKIKDGQLHYFIVRRNSFEDDNFLVLHPADQDFAVAFARAMPFEFHRMPLGALVLNTPEELGQISGTDVVLQMQFIPVSKMAGVTAYNFDPNHALIQKWSVLAGTPVLENWIRNQLEIRIAELSRSEVRNTFTPAELGEITQPLIDILHLVRELDATSNGSSQLRAFIPQVRREIERLNIEGLNAVLVGKIMPVAQGLSHAERAHHRFWTETMPAPVSRMAQELATRQQSLTGDIDQKLTRAKAAALKPVITHLVKAYDLVADARAMQRKVLQDSEIDGLFKSTIEKIEALQIEEAIGLIDQIVETINSLLELDPKQLPSMVSNLEQTRTELNIVRRLLEPRANAGADVADARAEARDLGRSEER